MWAGRIMNLLKAPAAPKPPSPWDIEQSLWKPPSLPARRGSISGTTPSLTQADSAFFQAPVEIRLMIYELLFTGATFHLYPSRSEDSQNRRFRHHRCSGADPTEQEEYEVYDQGDVLRRCMQRTGPHFGSKFWPYPGCDMFTEGHPELRSNAHVAVLRTCRQAYLEGIDKLYRANIFDFASPIAFNWFVDTIVPKRLGRISTLQIRLDLDSRTERAVWVLMWKNIAERMKGLENLLVVVRFTFDSRRYRAHNRQMAKRIRQWSRKCVPSEISKFAQIKYRFENIGPDEEA